MAWFNKTPPPPPPKTFIARGTSVNGRLSTRSDIELEGTLTGSVRTEAVLRIFPGGAIEGDADCRHIDCGGTLNGTIRTTGILTFRHTAVWCGELDVPRLLIEKGARLEGLLHEKSK